MVDVREPSPASGGEQCGVAVAHDGTYYRRNPAGRGDGIEPVVVGGESPGRVSFLVDKIEPWLLTEADIPWLNYLCRKKYSHRYDPYGTENWFRNYVLKQPLNYLQQRMPNAFCISMLTTYAWLPAETECTVAFICADDNASWEAMKLLRHSVEWAKRRRCVAWRCSSETDSDLTLFCRRVGATEISPRFNITF